ncbi:hypothetical protein [Limnoglobus roseus]|uniref:Uncharacterized protein n=1 Tax=Limnoglobus roseus TaxID=2598579 RepID=A0A5C1A7N0_9BACT|nr:hypothetical protein [Limnoglobus roseus]QEL13996.1 hypothetical protein PX52LOC_00857 [Limnoglobus roseus]
MSDTSGDDIEYFAMSFADFCKRKKLRATSIEEITQKGLWSLPSGYPLDFQQILRPTDVVYYYDAEQSEWDKGFGSEGYVFVRDDKIIGSILLRMN